MRPVLVIAFFVSLFSCSNRIPFPATYTDYHDPSVVSFVDKEYIFKTADRFEYIFFSDNIDNSRYGYGDYLIKGRKLVLNFTEEVVEPESAIESKELPIADTSRNYYTIAVTSSSGMHLEGINVLLTDLKGNYLTGISTDSSGNAELTLLKGRTPVLLKFSSIGYDYLDYKITADGSRRFIATLAERSSGTRITKQQWKKRIRFRKDALIIASEKFVRKTVTNKD